MISTRDLSRYIARMVICVLALGALPVVGGEALAENAGPAAAAGAKSDASEKGASEKIVSIGGDATEILYALGLDDRIIAVDSTSLFPESALKDKANVGYMRQLTTEGILSTGGAIVIASASAGPPDVVRALKSANIRYETLPGNETADNVAEKVRFLGKLFSVEDKAEALAAEIDNRFKALEEKRSTIKKPLRALFILGVSSSRAMIGGTGSTADVVLRLAGAENAASEVTGYKPLTDEALISLAPDAIITIRRTGVEDTDKYVAALPGFSATPAGKANRIISMDAHYLLGFGPRTPQAAESLMTLLYPGKG
ncbi:MAG: hemin ABC transporter substrate-binding protein [Hyphomicrobiaceae bacterium]